LPDLPNGAFTEYRAVFLVAGAVVVLLNAVAVWVLSRFIAKRGISLVLSAVLSVGAIVIPIPIAMAFSAFSEKFSVNGVLSGLVASCVSVLVPAILYANFIKTPEDSPIGLAKGVLLALCCCLATLIMAIPVSLVAAFVTILLGGLK